MYYVEFNELWPMVRYNTDLMASLVLSLHVVKGDVE